MATPARKAAPISALDAHLGYWLRVVSNHVSHGFQRKVEGAGVTVAEWVILRALYEGEARPSALADQLGITRGAISKLLDRLIDKRLLVVRADAVDGRAQVAKLTPAGRRLVPKLAALADQNDAEAFASLDAREQRALRTLLVAWVERSGVRSVALA